MGFTSKQIDEDLTLSDIELLITLDNEYDKKAIKRNAISTAKGFSGDLK